MATIESFEFNSAKKELSIVFGYAPNRVYVYKNVSEKDYDGMESAESKGTYFHAVIKPKYGKDFVTRDIS